MREFQMRVASCEGRGSYQRKELPCGGVTNIAKGKSTEILLEYQKTI
jgi:hypothetical protein